MMFCSAGHEKHHIAPFSLFVPEALIMTSSKQKPAALKSTIKMTKST